MINKKKTRPTIYATVPKEHEQLLRIFETTNKTTWTPAKLISQLNVFYDIICTHKEKTDAELTALFEKYQTTIGSLDKIELRHGLTARVDYERNMRTGQKNNPQNKPGSLTPANPEFWIKHKGYTHSDAVHKTKEHQAAAGRAAAAKRKLEPARFVGPNSYLYWTIRGHSIEDAKALMQPHLNSNTLSGFIERHGVEAGKEKWLATYAKRKSTMAERYGSQVVSCNVSKESLRFFVSLYRELRKSGIAKHDICWGISGSKEFAITDKGTTYFYDFVIKSKKTVIEYNNTFWHYKPGSVFKNPWYTAEEITERDLAKKQAIESRGFSLHYVWSDDNVETAQKMLLETIRGA